MNRVIEKCQSLLPGLRRGNSSASPGLTDDRMPKVLAVISSCPDRTALERLASVSGWQLTFADSLAAALHSRTVLPPVVLYQRELAGGDWRVAVRTLSRMLPRPCVILLSSTTDRNLWDELERSGGSDLLKLPLDNGSTLRSVNRAWALWRSQQRLREAATARGGVTK
jgi:PleD family two-component response regulator